MPSSAEEVAAVTWKPSSSIAAPSRRRIAEPRYRASPPAPSPARRQTRRAFLVSRCAPFRAERIPLLPRVGARSDADADAGATFALTDEDVEVRGPPSPSPPSREWPPFPSPKPRAAKKVRGDLGERLPSPERLRQRWRRRRALTTTRCSRSPPPRRRRRRRREPEPEHVPLTGEEYRQYVHNMAYAAAESAGLGAAARALDVMEIAVRQQRDPDTRGTLLAEGIRRAPSCFADAHARPGPRPSRRRDRHDGVARARGRPVERGRLARRVGARPEGRRVLKL